VAALEEALSKGRPEIFNTDQGSQFTGEAFTGLLKRYGQTSGRLSGDLSLSVTVDILYNGY